MAQRHSRFKWVIAALFLILGSGALVWKQRIRIAKRATLALARPISLEPSDVIFVMGGDPQLRLTYAVELLKKGYGKELWAATTRVTDADRDFERTFGFRSDEEAIVAQALKGGATKGRTRILPGSVDTYSDIALLKSELKGHPAASVLIVSSPYHLRRIDFCVGRQFSAPGGPKIRYAYPGIEETLGGLPNEDKLLQAVLTETMKLAAYRIKY